MHTVLLAEPQRVVRAGRSLLAEYKVSVIFQVSVTQAPAAQSTTKVRVWFLCLRQRLHWYEHIATTIVIAEKYLELVAQVTSLLSHTPCFCA
jgi:hypothetical protein